MSQMLTRVTADGAGAIFTGSCAVGSVVLSAGAGAAARCTITDAIAGGGSTYLVRDISAVQGTTVVVPLHTLNASAGVYLEAISGAGAVVGVELI